MKNLSLIVLISLPTFVKAQLPFHYPTSLKWYYNNHRFTSFAIDTLNGDTIKLTEFSYYRINTHSDTLEELRYDNSISIFSCNDEGVWLTGHFIKYFQDMTIAESGNYVCNRKVDEWFYYYPNGQLKKYENFYRPFFQESPYFYGSLFGIYKEYYDNGITKTYGSYKIIWKFENYLVFNSNTYEDEEVCCKWKMESVKDGTWLEFNSKGKIISRKRYFTKTHNNDNIMDLPDILTYQNKIGLDTVNEYIFSNFYRHR